MNFKLKFVFFLVLSSLFSCGEEKKDNIAQDIIDKVKKEQAPDSRTALFDIQAVENGEKYLLNGESNLQQAVQELKQKLQAKNISYTDSIRVLPESAALEGKIKGIIKISVANLRKNPRHSAELVSQATLGMPVNVLQKKGGWYHVQTPDKYLAWVDYGGIANKTAAEFSKWKAHDKLIFIDTYGNAYQNADSDSQVVSDLVAGDILELDGEEANFYKVRYPNDKIAFIEKIQAAPYDKWLGNTNPTGDELVATSKKLMGLPYLWGGTSPKGVDCSGFTKTVYFLNGMIIPRDASQQINSGTLIDSTKNFKDLKPGDLLFFGKKATDSTAERVIHVGMWIGEQRFIHSMGSVHISTFDTTSTDFDVYNYNRYLRTKRIANKQDSALIYLKNKAIFKENNLKALKNDPTKNQTNP
ncbi:MAG TPA: glycoside hydrolase [Leeuwenhoekiella sp.]|nr:glycoside hydrolase [Leeuwenhoekiella sp.]